MNRKVKYEKELFRNENKEQSREGTRSISSGPELHAETVIDAELGNEGEMSHPIHETITATAHKSHELEFAWLPPKKRKIIMD